MSSGGVIHGDVDGGDGAEGDEGCAECGFGYLWCDAAYVEGTAGLEGGCALGRHCVIC